MKIDSSDLFFEAKINNGWKICFFFSHPQELEQALNILQNYQIYEVGLQDMLDYILNCDQLDDDPVFNSNYFKKLLSLPTAALTTPFNFLNMIYPGNFF